ncbi:hypothetical protein EG329_006839 [Mollisiaceae sp. DMI_Dod_QoI]|nr:hypothetical protein EG329_006839 [Helotiales sp. DMI_Dod_QoI]
MDLFRVRLNNIDHYQSTPTQFDPLLRTNVKPSQLHKEPKVPVIRVFGATETGQKVCAHIHGAFPYLYIEYSGSLVPDDVGAYIRRVHLSIDFALAASYRRNTYDGNAKFVARITLVKGVPFYGFHVGYRYYLKIYMLNPMVMTRLSDLLRQGVIMKKVFQPYEAHLQYILQWMTDYNLYGCGFIDSELATFRSPVPQYDDEMESLCHLWHDRSIPKELITHESTCPRVSHCAIEVDICVQNILNRKDIKPRPLHHDFIERLSPQAPNEKLVHSMAGLWRDETRRRKSRMSDSDPGSSPFPPEVMISMSADPRHSQRGGWIHEEEYREKIQSLIVEERDKSDGAKLSFNNFIKPTLFDSSVRTTLESVEDLYPENLHLALGGSLGGTIGGVNYHADDPDETEVDENRILGLVGVDDESQYDSDEDVMREMELSQKRKGSKVDEKHLDSSDIQKPEHDIDDEFRPGGEHYGDQFLDSKDNLDSSGVGSSSGAPRNTTDSLNKEQRLEGNTWVTVPKGTCGRNLRPSGGQFAHIHKRSISPESSLESRKKRQKLFSIPENNNVCNATAQPVSIQASRSPASSSRKGQAGNVSHPNSADVAGTVKLPKPKAQTLNDLYTTAVSVYEKSSQESLKGAQLSLNQPLPFPVTKDAHDTVIVPILSQKSASQPSQRDVKKHLSFDPFFPSSKAQHGGLSPSSSISARGSDIRSSPLSTVLDNMNRDFAKLGGGITLLLSALPPLEQFVRSTMQDFDLSPVIYQDAFYSNEADVPERPRDWAGREFRLESLTAPFLSEFDPTGASAATFGEKAGVTVDKIKEEKFYQWQRRNCTLQSWIIAESPPTYSEVVEWSHNEIAKGLSTSTKSNIRMRISAGSRPRTKLSQIDGPTQKNEHGFKYTQNQNTTSVKHEAQYMSTMSLEIHVNTRDNFVPNPEEDEVQSLFWCLRSNDGGLDSNGIAQCAHTGIVVLSEDGSLSRKMAKQVVVGIQEESSELDLMIRMVEIVREYDPDILTGYEVHGGSWGYLIERARLKYDYNLCDEFSRMKAQSHGRFGKDNDKWGFNNTSTIRITGRHMINIWRAMRSELNLLQYTMENVVFHLLHRRIPHFSCADLTRWYTNGKPRDLAKVIHYYTSRIQIDLEILEQNELIPRTSEQARLLGVDFFSVFSRGSQFKVESLMFRIAKPENFLLVSPSRKQVGGQNALECLPLVMEPQSAFYTSPLLVLDFQSLYPSVMIAYNYCYSTFLGRVVNWRGTNKMGFTEFKRQQRLLELLKDHINIAPNGVMYTKPEIRKSLLAKMLGEILETRVMVKSGMKVDKDDKALQRLLNNRQLALKLIANVTYGYTSASFSGRMPCSEIADSIVQTGRETLEKAIALIHSVKRWGAEVVYGDTDSLFVYLKGRTKDQAFDIGEEIAKTVTNMNPRPVKLKFEKVYFPCVLLAKKRYVGFKYENRNQTVPDFDAKGIETVRRDGTPAEQKIEEKALKILFRTSDLSQIKEYFQQQCEKIMRGHVSVQDFCFAREVKLGTYSDKGPPPPGALISTKRMLEDARAEPQYGERVPYVVITGAPGARLVDRCVAPEELLQNDHSELDADYYISKNLIPPLERIFNLVGANVRSWYDEMPKVQRIRRVDTNVQLQGQSKEQAKSKKTLESYMKSSTCLVCKEKLELEGPICSACLSDKPNSVLALRERLDDAERMYLDLRK